MLGFPELRHYAAVITENLVCMPTPFAEENDRGGLEVAERRVLDRKAGSAKRNPVSAREEIALVNTTTEAIVAEAPTNASLRGLALVSVVKSSDLRNHYDAPTFWLLHSSRLRSVLA